MKTTVKEITIWTRKRLDEATEKFGNKKLLHDYIEKHYGISHVTVRNFHIGTSDNPTQNTLDTIGNALRDMESKILLYL